MSQNDPWSDTGRFLAELRRRHVVRFSIAYAAAAFVVLQLAEIVFPAFGLGEGQLRILVVVVALGFIPAVVLAWIYDLTKDGIRRTEDATGKAPPRLATLVALALTTIGVSAGVGWYVVSQDVGAGLSAPALSPVGGVAQPIQSLAVLPLNDYSEEGGQAYLAAGMHDEIIATLSLLEGIRVVSRTTSMRYSNTMLSAPEIGRELGVDALIEGSVNRSGDQVRITLQIIHAASDTHLGTLQFDRGVDDLLALQADVAQAVAAEIGGGFGQGAIAVLANVSPTAQEAYLRGRHEYDQGTPEGYQRALAFFQEAVDSAPQYAQAMAGLAGARFLLALEDPESSRDEMEQARAEVAAALALDSSAVEVRDVYDVIGRALFRMRRADGPGRGDRDGFARGGALNAPDLSPLDTTWVAAMTTLAQRVEERARASMIEGEGVLARTTEGRLLMAQGRFTEAVQILIAVVEESPETALAWDQLMRAHVALGEPTQAADVVREWSESGEEGAPSPQSSVVLRNAVERQGRRGYWTWRRDFLTREQAEGREVSLTELAAAHAVLGDRNHAYELLALAVENRETRLLAMPNDPVWDPLRRDPRFRAIERQVRDMRRETSSRILEGATG